MARRAGHVFISYKREEAQVAKQLRDALEADGFTTWWDEDIQTGQQWAQVLDHAVNTATAIVVLWSERAVRSRWVCHEASAALNAGTYAPARIELVSIPTPYDRVQATDLLNWHGDRRHAGYASLRRRLDELMPRPTPLVGRVVQWGLRNATTMVLAAALVTVVVAAFVVLAVIRSEVVTAVASVSDVDEKLREAVATVADVQSKLIALDGDRRTAEVEDLLRAFQRFPCERAPQDAALTIPRLSKLGAQDRLEGTCLRGAYLARIDLVDASLKGANLEGADLVSADLEKADLEGANLAEANLTEADIENANLEGANLMNADLAGADLENANLEGANLAGADLTGADLLNANLEGANLEGANVERAELLGAKLDRALLRGANLNGADVFWATFEDADLVGARLEGIRGLEDAWTLEDAKVHRSHAVIPAWMAVPCTKGAIVGIPKAVRRETVCLTRERQATQNGTP